MSSLRKFIIETQDGTYRYTGYVKGDPLGTGTQAEETRREVAHMRERAFAITGSFPVITWPSHNEKCALCSTRHPNPAKSVHDFCPVAAEQA